MALNIQRIKQVALVYALLLLGSFLIGVAIEFTRLALTK